MPATKCDSTYARYITYVTHIQAATKRPLTFSLEVWLITNIDIFLKKKRTFDLREAWWKRLVTIWNYEEVSNLCKGHLTPTV